MAAFGLLLLAAAGVTALVGALTNEGTNHALNRSFEIFGWTVHGSTGRLFAYGVIVGVVGLAGLLMMLAGLSRRLRIRSEQRRRMKGTAQEAESLAEERDRLAAELAQERSAREPAVRGSAVEEAAVREPVADAGTPAGPVTSAGAPTALRERTVTADPPRRPLLSRIRRD